MIGRDSCGCLYLKLNGTIRLVNACDRDRDQDQWSMIEFEGSREPKGELEPVSTERADEILSEWSSLIADGYDMRDVRRALKGRGE
jgi:hypothetical protein